MEFNLFKRIDRESIVNAYVAASKTASPEQFTEISMKNLKKKHSSGIIVELSPGPNLRKKGTLQRGQVEIIKSRGYENDSMYLVVSCNRKWAKPDEVDMQRYALVACISHSDPKVDLYNPLKLQVTQRARERSRGRV